MINKLLISSLVIIVIICGCYNDDYCDVPILFVGDSQIANWDTEYSFPNRMTSNKGQDGATLLYLETVKDIAQNTDVVIEIGTNDIQGDWNEIQTEEYLEKYVGVIMSFPGRNKYILEVFPTSNSYKNRVIVNFNQLLKKRIESNCENVVVIDVYDKLQKDGLIKEVYTRDGVHLNDYGYRVVTNEVNRRI